MERSKTRTKAPDARDMDVGRRIRAQRLVCRMSQTELANNLGVTFQQVQKYEKGVNRVGAGRLSRIADVLGVPVAFFFSGDMSLTAVRQRQHRLELPGDRRGRPSGPRLFADGGSADP